MFFVLYNFILFIKGKFAQENTSNQNNYLFTYFNITIILRQSEISVEKHYSTKWI